MDIIILMEMFSHWDAMDMYNLKLKGIYGVETKTMFGEVSRDPIMCKMVLRSKKKSSTLHFKGTLAHRTAD